MTISLSSNHITGATPANQIDEKITGLIQFLSNYVGFDLDTDIRTGSEDHPIFTMTDVGTAAAASLMRLVCNDTSPGGDEPDNGFEIDDAENNSKWRIALDPDTSKIGFYYNGSLKFWVDTAGNSSSSGPGTISSVKTVTLIRTPTVTTAVNLSAFPGVTDVEFMCWSGGGGVWQPYGTENVPTQGASVGENLINGSRGGFGGNFAHASYTGLNGQTITFGIGEGGSNQFGGSGGTQENTAGGNTSVTIGSDTVINVPGGGRFDRDTIIFGVDGDGPGVEGLSVGDWSKLYGSAPYRITRQKLSGAGNFIINGTETSPGVTYRYPAFISCNIGGSAPWRSAPSHMTSTTPSSDPNYVAASASITYPFGNDIGCGGSMFINHWSDAGLWLGTNAEASYVDATDGLIIIRLTLGE